MKKKKLTVLAAAGLAGVMVFSFAGCGEESKSNDNSVAESSDSSKEKEPTTYGTIEWPSDGPGSLIPAPKSKTGEIMWDSADTFLADVAKTSKSDFSKYINKCKEKGFSVDYYKGDASFSAENKDGYKLTLMLDDDNIMSVSVDAPDDESSNEEESSKKEQSSKNKEESSKKEQSSKNKEESSKKEQSSKKSDSSSKKESSKKNNSDKVTASFKKTMDEYEEFMDKYVDFMKSYDENDITMLSEYTELLSEYSDFTNEISKIDEGSLSSADLAYYLDVKNRVNKKLLEIE